MFPRLVFTALLLMILAGIGYGLTRLVISRQPLPQAMALIERHDPRAAQLVLRPLVRDDPRNAEAHVLLARTQLDLHDPVAAEREIKIARALRYERMVITPLLARSYMMQGRYRDVLADVPATAANDEERVTNLALRASAYVMMGDLSQAQSSLDAAAGIMPNDPRVSLARARIELARGNLGQALAAVNAGLAETKDRLDALLLKSAILLRSDDNLAALDILTAAVDAEPYSVPARTQRANVLIAMNQDAKARLDVDAAISVNWHDIPLALTNALLMMRAGKVADALNFLQGMQTQFEAYPKGFYYMALALSLQNQNDSAYGMLARFQKLRPRDPDGLRLQGLLEQRLGRPEASLPVLNRAIEVAPKDAQAHDLLGRAYFVLGRMPEALASYRRAIDLQPLNKDFAAHLAAAQVRFGQAPATNADTPPAPTVDTQPTPAEAPSLAR